MPADASEPQPILRGIVPILPVRSITNSVAFYAKIGFTADLYEDGDGYAFLNRDDLQIHLRRTPDLIAEHNPAGIYFYLHQGAAAPLETEFLAAGVTILSPLSVRPWKMLEFMLSDPDGNLLRFGEYASR
ncbi:MAG TPA: VOC family protein [Acidobacteriaceae bacterium]|nr:VOC family protein [Acidobacteriaceae bacterium]